MHLKSPKYMYNDQNLYYNILLIICIKVTKYTSKYNIHVTPHTFRHTKASHLVETNIPLFIFETF